MHEVLRSPGRPLDLGVRNDMEQRFGHDFSQVRIHTSALAAESTRALGAHAYTVGTNIVFGSGGFAPTTNPGRKLIAHELAHVIQQMDMTARQAGGMPGARRGCRRGR